MKIIETKTKIFGENCVVKLMDFEKIDGKEWKKIFDSWKNLQMGLKEYGARGANLPEGLSEVAFCLFSGSGRLLSAKNLSNTSFDTYNIKTKKAEQIKASSVKEDLTSFGPTSRWDDLYFLDFYNNGKLDGTFNVYKVPTRLIHEVVVKKKGNITFLKRQKEGKRPRFSITKEFIYTHKIKPVAKDIRVW